MDKRIQIWNILHDGQITAISDDDSENITMFVSIPYIRRRLKPLGDSFVLQIKGLKHINFQNFDGTAETLQEVIETSSPEILSTDSESMPVKIFTTMGQLTMDFESIQFALDIGQEVEFEAIKNACEEFWTEWKSKHQQSK